MLILTDGDTDQASTLVIGAQHTNDPTFVFGYLKIIIISGQFEAALQAAESWQPEWEIDLLEIGLKEQYLAEILMIMGDKDAARKEAQNALVRIEEMKEQLPGDYRLLRAELRAYAVLGDQQKVTELNGQYLSARPFDAVRELIEAYSFAQSLALAGMTQECIANLDLIFSGNNATSFKWVELDPYFNQVRNEPEFIAMMERHR
jgi:tetratricopeptide (TPR) repeat protein